MWFKNLVLYRIVEPFTLDPETIAAELASQAFQPCAPLDAFSYGWDYALGPAGSELVHAASGRTLICARREERILPASVIGEAVAERIDRIETDTPRKVRLKERRRIRDDVVFDLLPRAFTRQIRTRAYIDAAAGWLVVDAASAKKADDLATLLAHSLPAFKFIPYAPGVSTAEAMTGWLRKNAPPRGWSIQTDCELHDADDVQALVRCQRQDLTSNEIRNHLQAGKQVRQLAIGFDERVSCMLTAEAYLKRLRFEAVAELDEFDSLDELARLDANFAFMTAELSMVLERLLKTLGEQ